MSALTIRLLVIKLSIVNAEWHVRKFYLKMVIKRQRKSRKEVSKEGQLIQKIYFLGERFSMATLKQTNSYFRVSCLLGLLLSCYALFVELKKEENENYEAFCDINEHISCTKAFSSKFGKGFGIIGQIFGENSKLNQPNSVPGIVFYLLLMLMSFSNHNCIIKVQTIFCIIANFMSVYLAYILYFILEDFCVICVGTYVINAANLLFSISKLSLIKKETAINFKKKLG